MPPVHYQQGGFPPEDRLDWPKLIPLIGPASAAVARYDGVLAAIPNPDVLLSPLTTQEAVLSSKIEGARATIGEVLEFEAGQKVDSPELRNDIEEILNYRVAMSRWERYIHEDAPDRLIQLAILHAEFEALHPFLDGNGRLGRMLVPLFLWQHGLIRQSVFYISGYFEARRESYYEGLLAISRDDNWTGWCQLFLEAVRFQAEDNLTKAQGILDLYEKTTRRLNVLTRSPNAMDALRWLFGRPIFRSADFAATAGLPRRTAQRLLGVLHEEGILRQITTGNGRRATIFGFPALLNLAEGRKVL